MCTSIVKWSTDSSHNSATSNIKYKKSQALYGESYLVTYSISLLNKVAIKRRSCEALVQTQIMSPCCTLHSTFHVTFCVKTQKWIGKNVLKERMSENVCHYPHLAYLLCQDDNGMHSKRHNSWREVKEEVGYSQEDIMTNEQICQIISDIW